MTRTYLGDQVYVEWTGRNLFLTTHNGICATNTIVLEPEVLDKLAGGSWTISARNRSNPASSAAWRWESWKNYWYS